MQQRNTPQKALESWKQIAAFLDRSERTARRWEAVEGLPVHRRRHQKHDSVFAYKHEIEAWTRRRTKFVSESSVEVRANKQSGQAADVPANRYLREHEAITRIMDCYIQGARTGDAGLMMPGFDSEATISGYCQGMEYCGSIKHVFEWITENGPAPDIEARFARIEIIETIAVVHLEVQGWSGKLVGANKRASDIFTLLKANGEWKITHKLFHWHES